MRVAHQAFQFQDAHQTQLVAHFHQAADIQLNSDAVQSVHLSHQHHIVTEYATHLLKSDFHNSTAHPHHHQVYPPPPHHHTIVYFTIGFVDGLYIAQSSVKQCIV